jgi:ATP-dependent helicase HrpB
MGGLEAMGLSKDLKAWRDRVCWLRTYQAKNKITTGEKALPDLSDDALIRSAKKWLKPYCSGVRSKSDLLKLDWQVSMLLTSLGIGLKARGL